MAEAHKRAYRHPKYKTSYRIKNWLEYKKSLRNDAILLSGSAETPSMRGHLQKIESEAARRSILISPSRLRSHSDWSFTFHYVRRKDSSNPS